jgi:S-DNA-T family DNA segregation ATPase FtsK/SpoIIIE
LKKQPAVQNEKEIQKSQKSIELKGILFIAAGLFLLASYAGLPTGFIGTFLHDAMAYGFGLGAVFFPFIFIAIGIGYFRLKKNLVWFGCFWAAMLFYLCLLGFLHHIFLPAGYETEPSFLPEGGGLAGGLLAMALHAVAGATGSVIILVAGMLAGLVLTGKLSLAALTEKAGDKIQDIRAARRERRKEENNSAESDRYFSRKQEVQPFFSGTNSDNRTSSPLDVYNNDEFADYNSDVRKPSTFKKILILGQKALENDKDTNTANDSQYDETRQENYVPAERMANHYKTLKERPSLITVYPEKQETRVLRPATGIITGHTDNPEPAPWEKGAMLPGHDSQDIPVSHYEERPEEAAADIEGKNEMLVPEKNVPGKPRYILTPNGVTQVTDGSGKAAASVLENSGAAVGTAVEAGTADEDDGQASAGAGNDSTAETVSGSKARVSRKTPAALNSDEEDEAVKKNEEYIFPPLELLNQVKRTNRRQFDSDVREQCRKLEQTLADFRVSAKVIGVTRGPSVTRYELEPAPGVKVSSVVNLADDIALRLAAPGVRVEAPIPGKAAIGIEAPNITNEMVSFREIVDCEDVRKNPSKLCVGLGKDIEGKVITIDLAKMPHLLVAGTTGSGKSVCVNTLLAGIMYKARPDEVKLILVDPKVVELTNYNGIPHLLVPVVTDAKKAASALHWAVGEMERRYKSFADTRVRDIKAYNAQAEEKMPYIVIVIDEMSDLMMVAKADVEDAILRLAQKARACGIHMVLATQRPSVDVITGIVKANIPSRIAFAVSSLTDSRTILDMGGAEKLLGKGDMLFYPIGANKPSRVQGAFVSDDELNRVTDFIKQQAIPVEYSDEVTNVALPSDSQKETKNAAAGGGEAPEEDGQDELLDDAIRLVLDLGQASASMLQRRFRIGYNRAARLVETMEELGIVGPAIGSKPRELLMSREEVEYKFLQKDNFSDSQ